MLKDLVFHSKNKVKIPTHVILVYNSMTPISDYNYRINYLNFKYRRDHT